MGHSKREVLPYRSPVDEPARFGNPRFYQKLFWPIAAVLFVGTVMIEAGVGWAGAVIQLLTSGLLLAAWLAAAYGWGTIFRALFRVANRDALIRVTTLAVGLGVMSLLVLGLGLLGWMNQPVSHGMLLIGVAIAGYGLFQKWRALRSVPPGGTAAVRPDDISLRVPFVHWWWLLVVPLAGFTITAAMLPAGFLWGADEPNAYDVVEYHLQVPREWFELGRIVPLTHNVFSFFPFNVEMHYLLAMHVMGGPWVAQFLAQMMHAAYIGLTVAAVYAAVADRGTFPAIMAALLAASTPWMPMLGSIAYDEGGLLLYGTLAMAWAMRGLNQPSAPRFAERLAPSPAIPGEGEREGQSSERILSVRPSALPPSAGPYPSPLPAYRARGPESDGSAIWHLAIAGVMAGFACGCKLTGVPILLIGIPMAVTAVWLFSLSRRERAGVRDRVSSTSGNYEAASAQSPSPQPSPEGERGPMPGRRAGVVGLTVFVLLGVAVFSPWLIRNAKWVGNPVFPEQQELLGRGYFSQEQSDRFYKAHKPRPDQQAYSERVAELGRQVFADWRFGYALLPLGALGLLVTLRRRDSQFLLLMLIGLTVFWLVMTHLQGRFYVLAIPIAAIGMVRAITEADRFVAELWRRWLMGGVVIAMTVFVFSMTQLQLDRINSGFNTRSDISLGQLIGLTRFDQSDLVLSYMHDSSWPIVLVGDAKAFFYQRSMKLLYYRTVFDVNRESPTDAVTAWTAELPPGQPVYLWVDPEEVDRLHRTYGTPQLPAYIGQGGASYGLPYRIPGPVQAP